MKMLPQMLLPLISKEILDSRTFQNIKNKQAKELIHFVLKMGIDFQTDEVK
jgi:hypothetical protein